MDYQTLPEVAQMQALEGVLQLLFHEALLLVAAGLGGVICLVLSTAASFWRHAPVVPRSLSLSRPQRWHAPAIRQGGSLIAQTRMSNPSVLNEFCETGR
jgi:hypothetical protein